MGKSFETGSENIQVYYTLIRQFSVRSSIIDKVTIFDEGKVRVEGHVPQFAQYMGYELTSRDSGVRTNHFEDNYIPFELKFRLPKLRKWRIISQRDELGRIVQSSPPQVDIQ